MSVTDVHVGLLIGIVGRRRLLVRVPPRKRWFAYLSSDEIDLLTGAVQSEFLEYGIEPDSEANEYGRILEDLIDTLHLEATERQGSGSEQR